MHSTVSEVKLNWIWFSSVVQIYLKCPKYIIRKSNCKQWIRLFQKYSWICFCFHKLFKNMFSRILTLNTAIRDWRWDTSLILKASNKIRCIFVQIFVLFNYCLCSLFCLCVFSFILCLAEFLFDDRSEWGNLCSMMCEMQVLLQFFYW